MKKWDYVLGTLVALALVLTLFPSSTEAIFESTSRKIAYSFEGDSDTGWGWSAANQMSWYTGDTERAKLNSTAFDVDTLSVGATVVTSTGAELNILDGVTSTTAELNILDGVTSTAAELNILDTVTSTAAELNILDGVTSTTAELNILDGVTATEAEIDKVDGISATAYLAVTEGISFTEDGSGSSYTGTIEIPAGALVHDVCITNLVVWNGTSASLVIGDDDDPNGWIEATDLKATDLVVGEVMCAADDGAWGGKNGAYLTTAGRRGRITGGIDSGWYYSAASEVIFLVTPGAADGSAGRAFAWVTYSVPTFVASTNA